MPVNFIQEFQQTTYRLLSGDPDIRLSVDRIYLSIVQDAKYPFILVNILKADNLSTIQQDIFEVDFEICCFARDKNQAILTNLLDKITNKLTVELYSSIPPLHETTPPSHVDRPSAYNRPPPKLAQLKEFEGDQEAKTTAHPNAHKDLSTGSTYEPPAEVEFRKRSNYVVASIKVCNINFGRSQDLITTKMTINYKTLLKAS